VLGLHDDTDGRAAPKVAGLIRLARAGVRVPPGVALDADELPLDAAARRAIDALLARGPVIVRSALAVEDRPESSAAGLGLSVAGCQTIDAVEAALTDVNEHRRDPWIARHRPTARAGSVGDQILVQHQIPRRWLAVAALDTPDPYVEIHGAREDALAAGAAPVFAGALSAWEDGCRAALARLCDDVGSATPATEHGLDVEAVIDEDGEPWAVQVRPLVRPLCPGWTEFRAQLERHGEIQALERSLVLDAEHNPAPLSPAHADLMRWLASQRDNVGNPTILAGWLYVETLPGQLQPEAPTSDGVLDASTALGHLRDDLLPTARNDLEALTQRLAAAGPTETSAALERARALFLAMIDTYMGVIVPARVAAAGDAMDGDENAPLSLRCRGRHLDVLPVSWDIASPSLSEVGDFASRAAVAIPHEEEIPVDEARAATLLAQWDDHLFALGLAPLRRVYKRAASLLDLDHDEVFLLGMNELRRALAGDRDHLRATVAERHARQEELTRLRPPPRIEAGRPLPAAGGRLRGIPIGTTFEGRLAPRRDLAALLADPPSSEDILVLPALTAQTAVALDHLGIRAVCCEFGGAMSHATLMARELGLSALVGCHGCTDLPAGRLARLDTLAGRLRLAPSVD
jgi:hypothetical protein